MNWKEHGKKWSLPNLRYYASIFLEGLWETTKICQDSQSLDQDLMSVYVYSYVCMHACMYVQILLHENVKRTDQLDNHQD
jgi:hypothetical protein